MTEEFINTVTERYIELYEKISGKKFERGDNSKIEARVEKAILEWLNGQ